MNKKTLWGGVTAGAVALGLVGGGTFAGWSDFNVQAEEVAAGHLTLNVGESTELNSQPLNLAPGINRYRTFHIASNDGDSVPNGRITATLRNFVDSENDCENNGEADAEAPTRVFGAGVNALDTDGITAGARCAVGGDVGELSDNASLQWRWTEPVSDATDCDSLNTYANQFTPGPSPYVNAMASGAIGPLENQTSAFEVLTPGQGICVLMTIDTFDHPSRPWHMNAIQGDSLTFDIRFDLVQV